MATLDVTFGDFTTTVLSDITVVNLIGISLGPLGSSPAKAVFLASQFDNVQISTSVEFVNTNFRSHSVTVIGGSVNASLWTLTGWALNNYITLIGGAAADVIIGTSHRDTIDGAAGGDVLDGGADIDMLSYDSSLQRVVVNLQTGGAAKGDAQGDTISNFENVTGSDWNDQITGDAIGNTINGGLGNDTLRGLGGADIISGDAGNDNIAGGVGSDTLYGGDGDGDTLNYSASGAGVVINLQLFTASGGQAVGDIFSGFESVTGSAFADQLTGDGLNNVLSGGNGADVLVGADGADDLRGGGGADQLTGGNGGDILDGGSSNDSLTGGAGVDVLTGGSGIDRFIFLDVADSGIGLLRDLITDFLQGSDKIDLSAIDAIVGGTNDAFSFIGNLSFTGKDGELRFSHTPTQTIVNFDTDGDGASNAQIALDGIYTLLVTDFIL